VGKWLIAGLSRTAAVIYTPDALMVSVLRRCEHGEWVGISADLAGIGCINLVALGPCTTRRATPELAALLDAELVVRELAHKWEREDAQR
jgi:hypothetical protein